MVSITLSVPEKVRELMKEHPEKTEHYISINY